ncbi:MAG: hypothetical protein AAFO91_03420, partial [Bacteroidota bacterium]
LPYTDRLYVTEYHDEQIGDTLFPDFQADFIGTKRHGIREHQGLAYEWVDYERAFDEVQKESAG